MASDGPSPPAAIVAPSTSTASANPTPAPAYSTRHATAVAAVAAATPTAEHRHSRRISSRLASTSNALESLAVTSHVGKQKADDSLIDTLQPPSLSASSVKFRKHHNQWTKRRELEEMAAKGLVPPLTEPPPGGIPGPNGQGWVKGKHPNQWTKKREREAREREEKDRTVTGSEVSASTPSVHTADTPMDTEISTPDDPQWSVPSAAASPLREPTPPTTTQSDKLSVHGTRSSTGTLPTARDRDDLSLPAHHYQRSDATSSTTFQIVEKGAITPQPESLHVEPIANWWPPPHMQVDSAHDDSPKFTIRAEDEQDQVFMVICATLASCGNRALCPKEIADVIEKRGWARCTGTQPFTLVSQSMRSHIKRAESANPPYAPLVASHELCSAPSREEEMCMGIDKEAKPAVKRGQVWFLSKLGSGYNDPFDGVKEQGVKRKRPGSADDSRIHHHRKSASVSVTGTPGSRIKLKLKVPIASSSRLPGSNTFGTFEEDVDSDDSQTMTSCVDSGRKNSKRLRIISEGSLPRLAAQQRLGLQNSHHFDEGTDAWDATALRKQGVMSPQLMFRPGWIPTNVTGAVPTGSFLSSFSGTPILTDPFAEALGRFVSSSPPEQPQWPDHAGQNPISEAAAVVSPMDVEMADDEEDFTDREGEDDYAEEMLRRDELELDECSPSPTMPPSRHHDTIDIDTPATTPRSPPSAFAGASPGVAELVEKVDAKLLLELDGRTSVKSQSGPSVPVPEVGDMNATLCLPEATILVTPAPVQERPGSDSLVTKPDERGVEEASSESQRQVQTLSEVPSVIVSALRKTKASLAIMIPKAPFSDFPLTSPMPFAPMLTLADKMGYTSLCETRDFASDGEEAEEEEDVMDDDDEVMMVGEVSSRSRTSSACLLSRTPDVPFSELGSPKARRGSPASMDSFDASRCVSRSPRSALRMAMPSGMIRPWTKSERAYDDEVEDWCGVYEEDVEVCQTLDLEELEQVWDAASPEAALISVKVEEEHMAMSASTSTLGDETTDMAAEFLTCSSAPYGPSPPVSMSSLPVIYGPDGRAVIHQHCVAESNLGPKTLLKASASSSQRPNLTGSSSSLSVDPPGTATSVSSPSRPTTPAKKAMSSTSSRTSADTLTGAKRNSSTTTSGNAETLAAKSTDEREKVLSEPQVVVHPCRPLEHPVTATLVDGLPLFATRVTKPQGPSVALFRRIETSEIHMNSLLAALGVSDKPEVRTTLYSLLRLRDVFRQEPPEKLKTLHGAWAHVTVAQFVVDKWATDSIKEQLKQFLSDELHSYFPEPLSTMKHESRRKTLSLPTPVVAKKLSPVPAVKATTAKVLVENKAPVDVEKKRTMGSPSSITSTCPDTQTPSKEHPMALNRRSSRKAATQAKSAIAKEAEPSRVVRPKRGPSTLRKA